jgi:hypothetical protein
MVCGPSPRTHAIETSQSFTSDPRSPSISIYCNQVVSPALKRKSHFLPTTGVRPRFSDCAQAGGT